jgi:hypothetical protein
VELSEYLTLIKQYYTLSKIFGWTPDTIDRLELEMYFDYIIASLVVEDELEEERENPQPKLGTGQDLLTMFNHGKG